MLESQAAFARRQGVSKNAVSKWKSAGYLIVRDGLVDVEATEARLAEAGLGRFRAPEAVNPKPEVDDPVDAAAGELDRFTARVLTGALPSEADSAKVKQAALAAKRGVEAQVAAHAVVPRTVAERVFFEAARQIRDAWQGWPARVGPLMAADLGLEIDRVVEVLTEHVQAHLADLGEPIPDLDVGGEG